MEQQKVQWNPRERKEAYTLFIHFTSQDQAQIDEHLSQLNTLDLLNKGIKGGNTNLLVLRKDITCQEQSQQQIQLFNALTCLSQLEGGLMKGQNEHEQTVIEKNFFKVQVQDNKHANLFHYGGLNVKVISNSQNILDQAEKYSISNVLFNQQDINQQMVTDGDNQIHLKLAYLVDPSQSDIQSILTFIDNKEQSEPIFRYIGIYPQSIQQNHLKPKKYDILEGIAAPQSYVRVGSMILNEESDIDYEKAVLITEIDEDYQRRDKFENLEQIQSELKTELGNPFFQKYQLADTFMRNIAFKLGKLEKFGA
ncbi:UNKNOWN [Stylonychia lemnae]|uniref:Uncharacterized protein n=1 Tax=Stylonychia lemnae TaxID=5949 RepID=A0A078AHC3_STYLE|nr:UNKNOWN [Stylonychia lemnae]|eukprot:CDW81654.1 UNKNOWN [Stylonychia lemnae]